MAVETARGGEVVGLESDMRDAGNRRAFDAALREEERTRRGDQRRARKNPAPGHSDQYMSDVLPGSAASRSEGGCGPRHGAILRRAAPRGREKIVGRDRMLRLRRIVRDIC